LPSLRASRAICADSHSSAEIGSSPRLPIIIDEDAAIDSAFFGSHAGRSCYARAHRSGWVLVVRQAVAQREPPVMLRVAPSTRLS
jgi:hypothetical protein